jgi:hypothetical protein
MPREASNFSGETLVAKHNICSIFLGAILPLAAPLFARAALPGIHWQTVQHTHPPLLVVAWYPVSHWITEQGPVTYDPFKNTYTPGLVVAGGGTITAPSSFGTNMYSSTLMDDHMNTLVHRTTDDLTLLHHAWTLDRVAPGNAGYVFHLTELSEATSDGFSSTLVAPVDIPLTLVSFTPDSTAGANVFDGYFQGTIPAGAFVTSMVEPLLSAGNPFVVSNESAAPFELTLHFAVPEPSTLILLAVCGVVAPIARRGRSAAQAVFFHR